MRGALLRGGGEERGGGRKMKQERGKRGQREERSLCRAGLVGRRCGGHDHRGRLLALSKRRQPRRPPFSRCIQNVLQVPNDRHASERTDLVRGFGGAAEEVEGRGGHAGLIPDPAVAWYLPVLAHVRLVAALRHLAARYRRLHLLVHTRHGTARHATPTKEGRSKETRNREENTFKCIMNLLFFQ